MPLLPSSAFADNWAALQTQAAFVRPLINSIVTASLFTAASLFLTSMAGYAFARFQFFGRNVLFALVVATLTIPYFAVIIPQFILIARDLHLTNTWIPADHVAALQLRRRFSSCGRIS